MRRIGEIFLTILSVALLPLGFLNFFSGIVAAIWLLILGQWGFVLLGIFLGFGAMYFFGFAMIPAYGALLASIAAKNMMSGRARVFATLLSTTIALVWQYGLSIGWVFFAFYRASTHSGHGINFPMFLWAYAVSIAILAQTNKDDRRGSQDFLLISNIHNMAVCLTALSFGMAAMFHADWKVILACLFVPSLIALCLVLAIFFVEERETLVDERAAQRGQIFD